jgi:hypothetical protein
MSRERIAVKMPMKFAVKKEPLPASHGGGGKKYDWPFEKMKVGECFYFPLANGDGVMQVYAARAKIRKAADQWGVVGKRFATRHIREKKAIGVWRIA